MSTVEQVQLVLEDEGQMFERGSLDEFREYYRELAEEGMLRRQEYTLPQLDTVGREIYHSLAADAPKRS